MFICLCYSHDHRFSCQAKKKSLMISRISGSCHTSFALNSTSWVWVIMNLLVIFAVLKTKQLLSTWPVQSLFYSQLPGVRECSVCEYIKEGSGHEGRGWGWLISYSQQGSRQTISGIQLLWTSHVSGMQQPWPTSTHCETIYGPCNGKRTCIKQGCAPGVSVWMGSMGAENSLMQKASYETREGKQRGEALLDTWRGWWIHQWFSKWGPGTYRDQWRCSRASSAKYKCIYLL